MHLPSQEKVALARSIYHIFLRLILEDDVCLMSNRTIIYINGHINAQYSIEIDFIKVHFNLDLI